MTPRERDMVARLCAERAGIRIDPAQDYLIENRLDPVARRAGFTGPGDLLRAVRDRGDERLAWAAVEAMAPAETGFFGEPELFGMLAGEVLPELARRREGGKLRIWCAACGAGQEVYSLAMLLQEHPPVGVTVELLASDLSERRLETAQRGLYSQFEVQRGLPARRLVRHFEGSEEMFAISPQIRQMVRWRRLNLLDDISRLGRFDVVLCRNVLGSLVETARARVLANLARALGPGGCLALGRDAPAPGGELAAVPGRPGLYAVARNIPAAA